MAQAEETRIDISTSKSNTLLYSVKNIIELKSMVDNILPNFIDIFSKKMNSFPIVWIIPTGTYLLSAKAKVMKEYYGATVIPIPIEEWTDYLNLNLLLNTLDTTYNIIFFGWERGDPLIDWINHKIIKKTHYILATAKDETKKELYKKSSIFIEVWANAQLNVGVKFPNCSKFHYVSHQIMIDDDNTFDNNVDDCLCGIKGETFLPQTVSIK